MKIRLFRASDDYHLHYRHWVPEDDVPRGFVVALHGIQSHSGWYEYSSQRMAEVGFDVRFLDRRGSGLNGCQRGHTPHYDRLVNDVSQFLRELKWERDRLHPGVPIILLGISWGGKVATVCACRNSELIDGLGLLYPGICAKIKPTRWQRFLLKVGIETGKGAARVPVPLSDPTLFTGEKDWQEFIKNDCRALHQVSLDFLKASIDLDRVIAQECSALKTPLLMMLAGRDDIIDNSETLKLLHCFATRRGRAILYGEARHTLEFEPNRHEIFSDLIGWMNQLCRQSSI